MNTPLQELLDASKEVFALIYLGQWAGEDPSRTKSRLDFKVAIQRAQDEVNAQTGVNVIDVIDKSWDMGWEITEAEALIALAAVVEFPDRKIMAIKAFRTRTDDGGPRRDYGETINRLRRAKEIIEVAQEVLN